VWYSCDSAVIPFPAPGVRVRQYRASRLGSFRAVPHKYSWMVWEAELDEVRRKLKSLVACKASHNLSDKAVSCFQCDVESNACSWLLAAGSHSDTASDCSGRNK
jgi:hypothetical protein